MSTYKPKGKLGSGSRFKAVQEKVAKEPGYSMADAAKVAAIAGRRKYGGAKMAKMAAKGRKGK